VDKCKNGHDRTRKNTYSYPDGRRTCRVCRSAYMKHYKENNRNKIKDSQDLYRLRKGCELRDKLKKRRLENLEKARAKDRERYHKNKEGHKIRQYRYHLKRTYGLDLLEYEKLFELQSGECAVCLQKPRYKLHVDHCHTTGEIRGLLCASCNRGMGYFRDDIKSLSRAVKYLQKSHTGIFVGGRALREIDAGLQRND